MTALEIMELVRDAGYMARIEAILFDVARDKAPGAVSPDLDFINGILNGEVNPRQMAIAVGVVNVDASVADDASLKTTVETVWPFFATAWVARTL